MTGEDRTALRRVTDAQTLKALTHPVRVALLEALTLEGPLTATEAGERIGQSPTTCSFHLRQLGKYGFVEEAGGGKGRARPWRMTSIGMTVPGSVANAESEMAAAALGRLFRRRQLARYQAWLDGRALYPRAWRQAASDSEFVFYLTPAELEQLNREIVEWLLPRCRERLGDPTTRPEGSLPVELLVFSYPIAPPQEAP